MLLGMLVRLWNSRKFDSKAILCSDAAFPRYVKVTIGLPSGSVDLLMEDLLIVEQSTDRRSATERARRMVFRCSVLIFLEVVSCSVVDGEMLRSVVIDERGRVII